MFHVKEQLDMIAEQVGATVDRTGRVPTLVRGGTGVTFRQYNYDPIQAFRFRAHVPSPGVPTFNIYPEGFQSFMSKLFGGGDVQLGHNAFDLMFMVKAHDAIAMRQLWTDAQCERLVAMREAFIHGSAEELMLEQRFGFDQIADPAQGLELVFSLCATDLYGREVLRALPEAEFHAADGEIWLPGPEPLRFGFIRSDEHVHVKLRAKADRVELTETAKKRFAELRATVELSVPDLVVVFAEHERSAATFLAAAEHVRQLIGVVQGDGVFR